MSNFTNFEYAEMLVLYRKCLPTDNILQMCESLCKCLRDTGSVEPPRECDRSCVKKSAMDGLKEIQEDKNGTVQDDQKKEPFHFGMEMIFRLLEDESNSMMPYTPLTKQGDIVTRPKILLFPGIEGFAKVFKNLTSHLDYSTALQYVLDSQTTSVVKIVEFLTPIVVELLSKDEPFTMVAYSYGTLVALEMVHVLESRGYAGTLICIDGAPVIMKSILKNLNTQSEQSFQSNLMCQLLSFYIPSEQIANNKINIFKCRTWEERVNLGLELVKNSAVHEAHYLRIVADTIYKRLKDLDTYIPPYKNLKSNVKLFKPTYSMVQDVAYDYGLSQFFQKPVEIQCFEGNHETILENEKLIEAINSSVQNLA